MSTRSQFAKFPEMTVRFNNPRLKNYILSECQPKQKMPDTSNCSADDIKLLFAEITTKALLNECNLYENYLKSELKKYNDSSNKTFWPLYNSLVKEYAWYVSFLLENTLIELERGEIDLHEGSFATALSTSYALLQLTTQELLTSGHEEGEYMIIDNKIKVEVDEAFTKGREQLIQTVKNGEDLIETFQEILWESLSKDWIKSYEFIAEEKIRFDQKSSEQIKDIFNKTLVTFSARTTEIYGVLQAIFNKLQV